MIVNTRNNHKNIIKPIACFLCSTNL